MPFTTKLFSLRTVGLCLLVFGGFFLLLQRTVNYVCPNLIEFDCPWYFPMSIFVLRFPGIQELLIAGVVVGLFFLFVRVLESSKYDVRAIVLVAVLLIVGTNLLQGFEAGLYAPVAGDYRGSALIPNTTEGQEYYHDAIKIDDPVEYLRGHNRNQLSFFQHGRTHPPGAILTYYALYRLLYDPALIAIALCAIAVLLTVFGAYKLFSQFMEKETARFLSFVFMLLPVVQVYYLATIDAVVSGLLIVCLAFFCSSKNWKELSISSLALIGAFFLTLASLFMLPVLVGYEVLTQRSIRRSTVVIGGLAAFHLALYFFFDYNVITTFRTASAYENPAGFMLLHDPVNYLFTRIEDVAEILLFFGPFLVVLMVRGLRSSARSNAFILALLGIAVLLAMFATGAWKTGETARACAFIYPFLLLPVGVYLDRQELGSRERLQLAALVFLQAVVMQLFGFYLW